MIIIILKYESVRFTIQIEKIKKRINKIYPNRFTKIVLDRREVKNLWKILSRRIN